MDNKNTIKAYDAVAPVYEEYSKTRSVYLESIERLVLTHLSAKNRLLDVGGGDGRRISRLTEMSGISDFVVVEPSEGMADICRQRTGREVHSIYAEQLDQLKLGTFDVVTALWNVFGHIPDGRARARAFSCIISKLKVGGLLILDVNNRHNASSYGAFNVLKRVITDYVNFDEARGDASYDWKIGDQTFKASGHLFIAREIEQLAFGAGFSLRQRLAVDYTSGVVSESVYKGQLFYVFEKE